MGRNFYNFKLLPDGNTEVSTVDETAVEIITGWGGTKNQIEADFYGHAVSTHPFIVWKWKFSPEHARRMLDLIKRHENDRNYYSEKDLTRLPSLKEVLHIIAGKVPKEASVFPGEKTSSGAEMSAQYNKLQKKEEAEILRGIPSGVWADHWANEQEENGKSFFGKDIIDEAPPPPASAKKWAKEVANKIVAMNNGQSLSRLFLRVKQNGYPHDAEHFGYHLGMQAVGHGVSWSDDTRLPHDAIKIPSMEFYD
jgi:hypothetical protein